MELRKSGNDFKKTLTCENKKLNYDIDDGTGEISITDNSFEFLYIASTSPKYKITGTLTVTANDNAKFSTQMFTCSVSNVTLTGPVWVDYDDDGQIIKCDLSMLENATGMFDEMILRGTSVGNVIKGLEYNTVINSISLGCDGKNASEED